MAPVGVKFDAPAAPDHGAQNGLHLRLKAVKGHMEPVKLIKIAQWQRQMAQHIKAAPVRQGLDPGQVVRDAPAGLRPRSAGQKVYRSCPGRTLPGGQVDGADDEVQLRRIRQ